MPELVDLFKYSNHHLIVACGFHHDIGTIRKAVSDRPDLFDKSCRSELFDKSIASEIVDYACLTMLYFRWEPEVKKRAEAMCKSPADLLQWWKGMVDCTICLSGLRLDKTFQCCNWDKAPLSIEQVEYSAMDSVILSHYAGILAEKYYSWDLQTLKKVLSTQRPPPSKTEKQKKLSSENQKKLSSENQNKLNLEDDEDMITTNKLVD